MRTAALLLALVLPLTACGGDDNGNDGEALSPCQEAAQCVLDTCPQVDDFVECIEEDNRSPFCLDVEVELYQCGQIECDAESEAVGSALAQLTASYDGQVCED